MKVKKKQIEKEHKKSNRDLLYSIASTIWGISKKAYERERREKKSFTIKIKEAIKMVKTKNEFLMNVPSGEARKIDDDEWYKMTKRRTVILKKSLF